jgi:alkaline phosphatase D
MVRTGTLTTRRRLLKGCGGVLTAAAGVFMPSLSRAADRPAITHGIQSGDVGADGAIVWARADRPSRMIVEFSTTDSFKQVLGRVSADALPGSDLTAKAGLEKLPPGQEIFYRIAMQNLAEPAIFGDALTGRFRSMPAERRDVTFCWSGDTCGQGWGIDEGRGGMRSYATMLKHRPDFFIHSGDNIYADGPIVAEVKLPNGEVWRNLVTEEKSKPAESLADFWGNYKYNLLDSNVRSFNAEVPILTQWDDHEVTNNWWPEEELIRAEHKRKGYSERFMLELAARGARAFHDYMPLRTSAAEPGRIYRRVGYGPLLDIFMLDMRSYRGPNGENRQSTYGPDSYFLGPQQIAWLKGALKSSTATWKVMAADMPIGLYVAYDGDRKFGSEAVAQGDDGPPLGRELEIADLLMTLKREGIRNTIWITADVHYTAAHRYDPGRARFQDFDPFWEFVSGPLHAGTYGPNTLDRTFGPEVVFEKAPSKNEAPNLPPSSGMQFFGHVKIDGKTEQLTVTLRDVGDTALWSTTLDPIRS